MQTMQVKVSPISKEKCCAKQIDENERNVCDHTCSWESLFPKYLTELSGLSSQTVPHNYKLRSWGPHHIHRPVEHCWGKVCGYHVGTWRNPRTSCGWGNFTRSQAGRGWKEVSFPTSCWKQNQEWDQTRLLWSLSSRVWKASIDRDSSLPQMSSWRTSFSIYPFWTSLVGFCWICLRNPSYRSSLSDISHIEPEPHEQ